MKLTTPEQRELERKQILKEAMRTNNEALIRIQEKTLRIQNLVIAKKLGLIGQ